MKVAMTGIFVDDPNEAIKFYTEVLGFDVKIHIPEMQLAIVVPKGDPKGTTLLLEPNATEFSKNYKSAVYEAGLPVIVFGTENLDREHKRLTQFGVEFSKAPTKTDWGYESVFNDGFGNLIMLIQEN